MGLFQLGNFQLHSGEASYFKIDCDALTDEDLQCIASLLKDRLPPFGCVTGIPLGGIRLAFAMAKYITEGRVLIVDDVLTTGRSMDEYREKYYHGRDVLGAVIFARNRPPSWIVPLFGMFL